MVSCAIRGCGQRTGGREKVRLFCIPSIITRECDKTLLFSRSRRAVWLERINQSRRLFSVKELEAAEVKPHIKVCSKHFLSGQPCKLFDYKSVDWAPSSNLGVIIEDPVGDQVKKIQDLSVSIKNDDSEEISDEDSRLVGNRTENALRIIHSVSGIVSLDKVRVSDFARIKKRKESDDEVSECIRQKRCNITSQETWSSWNDESQHEPQVKLEVFDEEFGMWDGAPTFCSISVQTEMNSSSSSVQTETNCLSVGVQAGVSVCSVGVQTILSADNVVHKSAFNCVTQDNVALRAELQNLRQFVLSEDQLSENNSLVKFYTGLPTYVMLKQVFDSVSVKIQHSQRNALSQFQEFLIVMMRLRLNLLEHDLGFRFGVSQSTVSKICDRWLHGLATGLEEQIPWPDQDALDKTMTAIYRKAFGARRVVIVSCFEVISDKRKQHKAVRFLIGITPQGKICFLSSGVKDSLNDKTLAEGSGILDKLLPGDILLADQGLNLAGCSGMCQPNTKFPIFSKGKTELPGEKVLSSTFINVRTYVERIKNIVRQKFRLLQSSISPELLLTKPGQKEPQINYIVRICCALSNLCPMGGDD